MKLFDKTRDFLRIQSLRTRINHDIRKMARVVDKSSPELDDKRIVLSFNASTRIAGLSLNAAFATLTGWSLRLQGVRVVHFVCQRGMTRCVLGTDRDNVLKPPPCQKCLNQSSVIYNRSDAVRLRYSHDEELAKELQDTDLAILKNYVYENIPLGELCLPSMRWVLRRHHLEDDDSTRILYRHYILSAYKVAKQFEWLIVRSKPLSVMVFNGMQFPEAAARWMARKYDLPVYSHEVGLRPFSAFFTDGDATAYPVDIPADFQLSPQQNKRLDDYLSKRFKGDFSMAGVAFWPEMTRLSEDFLEKVNNFKQVVPVFTNVIFDTSQPHANVIFPHMFAWLDEILAVAKRHPETLFVIRAHPDESRPGKASRESVANWVQENDAEALSNVIFIGPDEYFSSYEMIQRAKFVMIYNSTIGMEASIMGAPVLCGGKARFTQLDTVFFPKSKEDYLAKLEEFLSAEEVVAPEHHQTNARRFLYYQLYCTSLPFDRFIKPDGIKPGFVRLREFSWQDLLPEKSETLQVVSDGLLRGKPFLLSDD
ncbi:MAG: hypothetical protein SVT56_02690 [Chloroflexota bacterium]|jgi:hypothetical protein|nr:hypothetical protein [Chloroflexota bacterium]